MSRLATLLCRLLPARAGQALKDRWRLGAEARPRSPEWPRVRAEHLAVEPKCRWCGGTASLAVHHIAPFHLFPQRELDPTNLITLCETSGKGCHFERGHLGVSWSDYNPQVVAQCDARTPDPVPDDKRR